MTEYKDKELERLRAEKQALLEALPIPRNSASESPVIRERLVKTDPDGRKVTLEWNQGQGWSIDVSLD